MSGDDTQTLVQKATGGDGAAVDALLARHLNVLLGYVRLHADPFIREQESCADIVQSVCREVLEEMDGFEYRGEPEFRKWLFTRAVRKLVDRKRYYLAQKRDVGRQVPFTRTESGSGVGAFYATIISPCHEAIAHETAERLERAFDQLPEDYRRVITLARLVGMTHVEIAAEMGREPGAVRALLHRALVRLGRLMDEDARAGGLDRLA